MHHVDILPHPSRSLLRRCEPHREVRFAAVDIGFPTRKHAFGYRTWPGTRFRKKSNGKAYMTVVSVKCVNPGSLEALVARSKAILQNLGCICWWRRISDPAVVAMLVEGSVREMEGLMSEVVEG